MYQDCVAFPSNHTKKELGIVLNKFVSLILLLGDEKEWLMDTPPGWLPDGVLHESQTRRLDSAVWNSSCLWGGVPGDWVGRGGEDFVGR